jgi:hypothetical protein
MFEEQVAAGIAWLDEHKWGWRKKIDLSTLDMGHNRNCVLGQVYGSYENTDYMLSETRKQQLGFTVKSGQSWSEMCQSWDELTKEWERQLERALDRENL